ncbi:hypothetical protein [Calidifontibacter indicus]|uniref:hypothetical protein n=1 Tax=Calidifontibacter indicus TaxID=419650 RepID=UPI003D71FC88
MTPPYDLGLTGLPAPPRYLVPPEPDPRHDVWSWIAAGRAPAVQWFTPPAQGN